MHATRRLSLLGLVLGLVTSSVVFASPIAGTPWQDTPPPDSAAPKRAGRAMPDPQKQTARLSRKLQLTPDQAAKIEPILQNRQQQMAQLRGDTSQAPRDLHQKMRALRQQSDSQIQAILTDSQRQQYLQMQQAAMQKHQESRQGAPAAKTGDNPDDDGGNP